MSEMLFAMLDDWKVMNSTIAVLREDQLKELLDREMSERKRACFIERLHQRYWKLRGQRERAELLQSVMGIK